MSTNLKPTIDNTTTMRGSWPEAGNIGLGYWLSEDVVAPSDDLLFLKGPRISKYMSDQYDNFNARHDTESMKYGISAVYNRTSETHTWITQYIDDVDSNGKKVTFSDADSYVSSGDTIRVYYYAKPAYYGGSQTSFLDGSPLAPEHIDALVRSWNDSVPMTFGGWGKDMVSDVNWRWRSDMVSANFTSGSVGSDSWKTAIDFSKKAGEAEGEWGAVDSDEQYDYCEFPIYATEIGYYFRVDTSSDEYPPKYISTRIKVDG